MTDLRKAAEMALDALDDAANVLTSRMFAYAAAALRAALDAQEPTRKAATNEELLEINELKGDLWEANIWVQGFRAAEKFHGITEGEP